MFGSHLSIAGGLTTCLEQAKSLRMECVQLFTKNQRQWKAPPLTEGQISEWRDALQAMPWESDRRSGRGAQTSRGARTVSHASYLINLASPDASNQSKSIALMIDELERCEALGIPLCVVHPGAHMGERRTAKPGEPHVLGAEPTPDERAGLLRIAAALDEIHAALPGYRVITCLETTAGAGTTLGYDFGHLAFIRERAREPERIACCLDTCHVTAAGYDLCNASAARRVLREWDRICGLRQLRVLHLNDSLGARGSRRDRHAHIGDGCCGLDCFRTLLNHRLLQAVPRILETPKGATKKGTPWDVINVRRLKRLIDQPALSR